MNDSTKKTLLWGAVAVGAYAAARALIRGRRYYDLADKTVIVTGGSRGLGLVLARECVSEGARVVICARDEAELDRARADLEARGGAVLAVPCDVTDQEQAEQMVRTAQDRFGFVHVLINNAGVIEVGPVEVMTLADFEEAMQTHFWAPLFTTLAVLPAMRRRGQGRIVNISSIGGRIAMPHLVPYDASKFALTGLSEGLRAELRKDGIFVTTVCPGLMRTGSPVNATFKGQHRAEFAWFSISDSLPLVTISAERAARQILTACKYGDAQAVLTWPAQLATAFHGLFPGATADLLGLVNAVLPGPGGIGTARAKGKDSTSEIAPSWLTALSDRAARRNNEVLDEGETNGHP
jgi:NAD(P)-dependent dehydrogenase (short-subunit alcohol dehydrogenase family)